MSVHPHFDPLALERMGQVIAWHLARGAVFASLPWTTDLVDAMATKPEDRGEDIATAHGIVVASGEQAFTKMARQGRLDRATRYIGWTPCFRSEPVFDDIHHYYFIKAELFSWIDEGNGRQRALDLARQASLALDRWAGVDLVMAGDEIEMMAAGIEVGSAGVRQVPEDGRHYAYCTALAEPRFGQALERMRRRE